MLFSVSLVRRSLLVLAVSLSAAAGAQAQTEGAARAAADETMQVHLLEIRDGALHLDGRRLDDAVPAGVDLSGLSMSMEYAGPVKPVVEIDGKAFVLVDDRLVRFDASLTEGRLYIAGEPQMTAAAGEMPRALLTRMGEQAYLQEIAERDVDLYNDMRREHRAEFEGEALAARIRSMPASAERDRLRAELRDHLTEVFRLKMSVRREELARAQAEIDSVRALLDQRDANLDAIVNARLSQLCGD